MATTRAALLNQELGFTIHTLEPVRSNLPEEHDEGQVQGSPKAPNENPSQTMAVASTDQTVKGAAIDSNKPGVFMLEYPTWHCRHCSLTPIRTGPSR